MQPLKKTSGLGIVLTLLLSSLPAPQARAEGWLGMFLKKVPGSEIYEETLPMKDQVFLATGAVSIPFLAYYARKNPLGAFFLLCGLITIPRFTDYFTRKPLKEKRFDSDILLNGTWKQKLLQIEYFISDVLWGWPYKDNKFVVKEVDGKMVTEIQEKQYPGGWFGNFDSWIILGALKSLAYPVVMLAAIEKAGKGIKFWRNPAEEIGNSLGKFTESLG